MAAKRGWSVWIKLTVIAMAIFLQIPPAAKCEAYTIEFSYFAHVTPDSEENPSGFTIHDPVAGQEATLFGAERVFEAPLAVTEDRASTAIGWCRGHVIFDSFDARAGVELFWSSYFYASNGSDVSLPSGLLIKAGSGISYRGFHYNSESSWELAVVGGTKSFRFCKGFALETALPVTSPTFSSYRLHMKLRCDDEPDGSGLGIFVADV